MNNEAVIRKLIRGSIHRAIQESVGALIVWIAFGAILSRSAVGSTRYYGCLLILVGAGFIAGVVWSHALSYRLLRSHPADDTGFWREAFQAQARLLRLVPIWYCAPLGVGLILFVAPTRTEELIPFTIAVFIFGMVLTWVAWLNRRASFCIDESAKALGEG